MKSQPLLLLLPALFASFAAQAEPAADAAFQKMADEFLHGYFLARPLSGVSLGLHEFDGLAGFADRKALSAAAEFDYRTLQLAVQDELFNFEEARDFEKNPMTYAQAFDFNVYLKRDSR